MIKFPYKKELSEAYKITITNPWLWVFGLFIGGATGNFSDDSSSERALEMIKAEEVRIMASQTFEWVSTHAFEFVGFVLLGLGFFVLIIFLQGIARGAILWSAVELIKTEDKRDKNGVGFRCALKKSLKYFYKIAGLQALLVFLSLFIFTMIVSPIVFLFSIGASIKAGILILLALTLFLPIVSFIFFSFIYGPIFIVMYEFTIIKSLTHSLKLIKNRFWQSLGVFVVLVLVGIVVGVLASALFAVVSAIGTGFTLFVVQDSTQLASKILFFGSILIASICVIVLGSVYTTFSQVLWTIVVKKMLDELEIDDTEEVVAIEPVT